MSKEIEELLNSFEDLQIKNLQVYEAPTSLVEKIKNGFNTILNKVKSSNFGRRCTALALAGAMTLSLAGCSGNKAAVDNPEPTAIAETDLANFNAMLNRSKSEIQKSVINSIKDFLLYFNIDFANQHIEKDKDIKAALTWDEVAALTVFYNDFSNKEIMEIFNGAELKENDMLNAYKTGFLMLMGAHVLEDSKYPVNIDMLLQSEEAKDFYNKYHDLFLAAKQSTGDAQLNYVKAFYTQLRSDFPISKESRGTSGIAHADPRSRVKDYYYSILPMLSASEILFQNLSTDYTLTDEEIALMNELGACNLAGSKFSTVAILAATAENSDYADYEALKNELVNILIAGNNYVIDDAHREITLLDEFFEKIKDSLLANGGYWIFSTNTYVVVTREEVESREEAIRRAGKDKVEQAEKDADAALEEENEKARQEAEEKAKEEADRLQQEADKQTEENQDRVDDSDKDFQDRIDDANNSNGPINEGDLGHGTDFDDSHSDNNGNLDDSVTDITTDPTGAVDPGTPLPDPNETGAAFDNNYQEPVSFVPTTESYETSVVISEPSTESYTPDSSDFQFVESAGQSVYEYEEPYAAMPLTNEQIAEAIVEAMASVEETSSTKVFTK